MKHDGSSVMLLAGPPLAHESSCVQGECAISPDAISLHSALKFQGCSNMPFSCLMDLYCSWAVGCSSSFKCWLPPSSPRDAGRPVKQYVILTQQSCWKGDGIICFSLIH